MEVLGKDSIEALIVSYLSEVKRGQQVVVERWRMVQAFLYRLKTGCQWRLMPLAVFFEGEGLSWQAK